MYLVNYSGDLDSNYIFDKNEQSNDISDVSLNDLFVEAKRLS